MGLAGLITAGGLCNPAQTPPRVVDTVEGMRSVISPAAVAVPAPAVLYAERLGSLAAGSPRSNRDSSPPESRVVIPAWCADARVRRHLRDLRRPSSASPARAGRGCVHHEPGGSATDAAEVVVSEILAATAERGPQRSKKLGRSAKTATRSADSAELVGRR